MQAVVGASRFKSRLYRSVLHPPGKLLDLGCATGYMFGPHFCFMKISQGARDCAAIHGISEETAAVLKGLLERAEEFRKTGGEIYLLA